MTDQRRTVATIQTAAQRIPNKMSVVLIELTQPAPF